MVKIYQIKKIHKEFLENLKKESKEISLGVDDVSFDFEFEKNFFQEQFEKENLTQSSLILNKDTTLELSGKGKVILEIQNDLVLSLDYVGEETSCIDLVIIVKQNVNLSLIELSKNPLLYKTLSLIIGPRANVKFGQYISQAKVNTVTAYLHKEASYNLVSSYFAREQDYYIINEARHVEENSSSNMDVYGIAQNNAKVISDGLVHIKQEAHNSSGHQNLKGLLLDKESSISSEPILEVFTNDVSCSHGASVTQIAQDVQFYLKSRGLNEEEIKSLIIQSLKQRVLSLFDFNEVLFKEIEEKITLQG